MKFSPREIGKNFLLVMLGLAFALMVMEVSLRLYDPLGFSIRGNKIILPFNRTQIIHNKIGGKLDRLVVNQKNSIGFRGKEPPADFKSHLTIVTVGGSTTECLALNEDKTWPEQLAKRLKKSFSGVWLDNAGLGGHSTFGHNVLMHDFLVKLKPKLVLLLVGINDVGRSDLMEKEHFKSIGKNLETVLASAAAESEVASLLLNLYRFYFPAYIKWSEVNELDFRSIKPMKIPLQQEEAIIAKHRQKYLQPYRQRLERFVDQAQEHGIDLVLITQPVLYGQGVDDVTGVDLENINIYNVTNGWTGWKVLELYNDVTRQVAKERGLLLIDLARELPKSSRYYYDWVHYSNEGAEKIAEILYRPLVPYLAKKFPNYYRGNGVTRH